VVTSAILGGFAAAGPALDWRGKALAGWVVIAVSAVGLAWSLGVPRRPAASPRTPYPWRGPVHTVSELWRLRKDRLLALVIAGNTFIWFAGQFQILVINLLGMQQLKVTKTTTGLMIGAQLVGLAAGGLVGGRVAKGERWHRVLAPTALAMGGMMLGMTLIGRLNVQLAQLVGCFALLPAIGFAGGMFMVPCEAFIQIRPAAGEKGKVIAASNFAVFCGILLAAGAYNVLSGQTALKPTDCFGLLGCAALLVGVAVMTLLRRMRSE